MNAGDWSLAYSKLLLEAFVRVGLTDVCVSPGARSTPLALAAWRDPRLRVHVVLDERSAAFVALGLAKASGKPAAIVCTSGTASANYLPAVVEGFYSNTPLVVLTADRPPRLRGTGANQTIDQRELYKAFVHYEGHTPVPIDQSVHQEWSKIAGVAAQRCARGPVHINVAFEEPLVPSGETVVLPQLDLESIEPEPTEYTTLESRSATGNGVVILGGSTTQQDFNRALSWGWPVFAEPQSNMRIAETLSTGALIFADKAFIAKHAPAVVVCFGSAPTSRATLRLEDSADAFVRKSARKFHPIDADPSWLELWKHANSAVRNVVDRLLDEWDAPFSGRVARDLASALPDGSDFCVGSSMAIRELDAFMRPRNGLRVIANRGASGIDGFVSTAFGVALAGNPTFALLGDLTLLHDASGLIWNAHRMPPVNFVVINDDGGGIFSFVPQASLPESLELFAVPHGIDLQAVAEAAGCGYEQITHASEISHCVLRSDRSTVFEVRVDRDDSVKRHVMISEAVHEALRGL